MRWRARHRRVPSAGAVPARRMQQAAEPAGRRVHRIRRGVRAMGDRAPINKRSTPRVASLGASATTRTFRTVWGEREQAVEPSQAGPAEAAPVPGAAAPIRTAFPMVALALQATPVRAPPKADWRVPIVSAASMARPGVPALAAPAAQAASAAAVAAEDPAACLLSRDYSRI